MPTGFIPLPNSLVQPIVQALANIEGQMTLAARVHILGLVCRAPGWHGLKENEFLLTPKKLAAAIGCNVSYASRIMASLKAQGWMTSSGIPGVHRIEPEVVYETVEASVIRRRSELRGKRAHVSATQPKVVVPGGSTPVSEAVAVGVEAGVCSIPVKLNAGEGFSRSQESRFPEDKKATSSSLSAPSGRVCAQKEPYSLRDGETPVQDEDSLARAAEVMAAYNQAAVSLGICPLSESDYLKLLPEIRSVISDPEGYPFLPAIQGMRIVPAAWFAKYQPNYRFTHLLEVKARKKWTEKLPATSAAPQPDSTPAAGRPQKKGVGIPVAKLPLEDRISSVALEGFRRLCVAYGNDQRINWELDGEATAGLVDAGEVTWDALISLAQRKTRAVSNPEMMPSLGKWLASRPWKVPETPQTRRSGNVRQGSDDAFHDAKASAAAPAEPASTPATENPLARMAREQQNALR